MLRTHTCGELTAANEGQTVTLCGWVDTIRDFGQGKFIDLRDRYGKTQITIDPNSPDDVRASVAKWHRECVVQVTGTVARRPQGQENPKLATGEIEVRASSATMLNDCPNPPFLPSQMDLPNEDLRLKYRFLDLRRKSMQETLMLRSPTIS